MVRYLSSDVSRILTIKAFGLSAADIRHSLIANGVTIAFGKASSNNNDTRRFSIASWITVRNSGCWVVSVTRFVIGFTTISISAGHVAWMHIVWMEVAVLAWTEVASIVAWRVTAATVAWEGLAATGAWDGTDVVAASWMLSCDVATTLCGIELLDLCPEVEIESSHNGLYETALEKEKKRETLCTHLKSHPLRHS